MKKTQKALAAIPPENVEHDGRNCQLRVLTREVLVVAAHTVGGWKAYIGVVAAKNHAQEWPEVLKYGDTLAEDVARFVACALGSESNYLSK